MTANSFNILSSTENRCLTYNPLGMENGEIEDSQLSASDATGGHPYTEARLHGIKAWKSDEPDTWIQVHFGQTTNVAAIATQGRHDGSNDEWVTRYRVEYSEDE